MSQPSAPKIVVVGSINMDLVIGCAHLPVPGETVIADSSSEVPGGKGANQAVAAARAGGDVVMIGRVGDDAFGDTLLQSLTRQGVDVALVAVSRDSPSGLAVVSVESGGENSILVVPGSNGLLSPQDIDRCASVIRQADVMLVQLEIPLATVERAITVAKDAGVKVILDPAPVVERLPQRLHQVDVICPNRSEASTLLGRPVRSEQEAVDAVSELTSRGAGSAIVTLGGEGVVAGDTSQTLAIPPFAITAVDTTAAGDAFAGALAVRLGLGEHLFVAARFAAAAGALAASRHGAQPGMPDHREIEQMLG